MGLATVAEERGAPGGLLHLGALGFEVACDVDETADVGVAVDLVEERRSLLVCGSLAKIEQRPWRT